MIYLILDTNIWLYLANSQDPSNQKLNDDDLHFKLYESLSKLVDEQQVEILRNEVITEEWSANLASSKVLVKKYEDKLKNDLDTLKRINRTLDELLDTEIEKISTRYKNRLVVKIFENEQHIRRVNSLLVKSSPIEINDSARIFASKWAVAKKAPFCGQKQNSMADALILFSSIEYIRKMEYLDLNGIKKCPSSIFVSANKNDFSAPHDVSAIHPDLLDILESVNMIFFTSLPVALNHINNVLLYTASFEKEEVAVINQDFDQYMAEVHLCRDCYPGGEYRDLNAIKFDDPEEVFDARLEYKDPAQLTLPFMQPYDLAAKPIIHLIQRGNCAWCAMEYVKCKCGCISKFDPVEPILECPECDLIYARELVPVSGGRSKEGLVIIDESFYDDFGDDDDDVVGTTHLFFGTE